MYTKALLAALTGVCAIVTSESLAEPPKSALSEPKPVIKPAERPALQAAPGSALEPRNSTAVRPLDTPAVKPHDGPVVKPHDGPVVKPTDRSPVQPLDRPVVDVAPRTELSVPIADRDASVYNQDDHLHTTPDKAFALFEALDVNDDRQLSLGEVKGSQMRFSEDEFAKVDTDGDEYLDREEFVGIGPSLESNYAN